MVKAFVQSGWHSVSNRFTLIVRSVPLLWRGDVGSWKMTCQDLSIYKCGKLGCTYILSVCQHVPAKTLRVLDNQDGAPRVQASP
jgi:hypothetical protein